MVSKGGGSVSAFFRTRGAEFVQHYLIFVQAVDKRNAAQACGRVEAVTNLAPNISDELFNVYVYFKLPPHLAIRHLGFCGRNRT